MPLYEFRCTKCGNEFECQQHIDDPPPPCPKTAGDDPPCGSPTERLISRSSFVLAGGGWAADGYGGGKP